MFALSVGSVIVIDQVKLALRLKPDESRFSSLIVPALATTTLPRRRRLAVAYAIGVAGYALGIALSALFDLPSGAVIVCGLVACALAWRAVGGRAKLTPPPSAA